MLVAGSGDVDDNETVNAVWDKRGRGRLRSGSLLRSRHFRRRGEQRRGEKDGGREGGGEKAVSGSEETGWWGVVGEEGICGDSKREGRAKTGKARKRMKQVDGKLAQGNRSAEQVESASWQGIEKSAPSERSGASRRGGVRAGGSESSVWRQWRFKTE